MAGTGAAALAYGVLIERNRFGVREETVRVLPAGSPSLRVLHLSDIHFVPGQDRKVRWLQGLADLEPDLVVNTGDNLSHSQAVPAVLEALKPVLRFPGVFVPGSNDYYAPVLKSPFTYFTGPSKHTREPKELPWTTLFGSFQDAGWQDLTNTSSTLDLPGLRLNFSGVDDPHLQRDRYPGFAGDDVPADNTAAAGTSAAPEVKIGVAHAPYQRVLNQFTGGGADIILAGHTHGGQVCIPGYGALVSNCDLPTWQARGLTSWAHAGRRVPLNVSAGIGTSRFAPVRFACRPEAVLLTLAARDS
ncbi:MULTISPECIES: metallophosphoesterase [unclassified Arthrobacter]|uniref:metallophosphoesterase n=1 Tax=unclassified Arthrobacter TaxID=235627 RepID=UPI001E4048C1|nr:MULTISPECIES: metallophosphoesterase [unclassified Arthrobacter]MCC9144696.1 metallophosphoesterase [Arthrobacter sp. zg-Y919]MDK1275922.1 metallophosphoesterase [Arthrobacter sp. zg.Y919]WIB04591.1 metallophosphoesterase [Arthrobacter sp. zg-Y919]